jgi:hypothetical protein
VEASTVLDGEVQYQPEGCGVMNPRVTNWMENSSPGLGHAPMGMRILLLLVINDPLIIFAIFWCGLLFLPLVAYFSFDFLGRGWTLASRV